MLVKGIKIGEETGATLYKTLSVLQSPGFQPHLDVYHKVTDAPQQPFLLLGGMDTLGRISKG